jgi:carbamoyl-phosphate synthase large subunit
MRPSYVLGGQNMIVAYTKADVVEYMGVITEHVDMDHPILLDKYLKGVECEVDAICDGTDYLIPGIMEQIERTGVHSGDSICVYPAQRLTRSEIDTIVDYTGRFARELHVVGLVNVQYAVSGGKVYVIEVNPPLLPHGALHLQGHGRADGRSGRAVLPGRKARGHGPRHGPAPERALRGRQGARVQL